MRDAGFSIVELLIASAMTMAVVGAILAVVNPAQLMFRAQGDAADLHQRFRAASDTMGADVRAAMAVRPYRVGATRDDAAAGVYYRPDTLTVLGVPSSPHSLDGDASRTYYLRGTTPGTFQLMQYDGGLSDLPMLDHVVRLSFEYFGPATASGPLVRLEPATLVDGPWIEDVAHGGAFDADLLRVREIRALLRLESTDPLLRRFVPDEEVVLIMAMRNIPASP